MTAYRHESTSQSIVSGKHELSCNSLDYTNESASITGLRQVLLISAEKKAELHKAVL